MTLMLGADPVTLYQAAQSADGHGWALSDLSAPVWAGTGNLQRQPGRADVHADQGGGHGPYAPNWGPLATLYLPPDAPVVDGLVAEVGGSRYYLTQARPVHDPRGTGDLDCWAATATGTDTWGP